MILSSVALVSKPKNGKNKESGEKKTYRGTDNDMQNESEVTCEQCRKEIEEENAIFKFPSSASESQIQEQNFSSCNGDRVTIATGDALCLSVERFYYTIVLRKEENADTTCIFRKKVLEAKSVPNGRVETVVFALDCDQNFYLTATTRGDLELNFHTSVPRADTPDERIFDVYFTNLGHALIQPKLHSNTYLHHIDQVLSVQQLDLNWRCPEEYFFHFSAVPECPKEKPRHEKRICTHVKDVQDTSSESGPISARNTVHTTESSDICTNNTESLKQKSDRFIIELPIRKQKKSKNVLSSLFLGCFSARSHRLSVS